MRRVDFIKAIIEVISVEVRIKTFGVSLPQCPNKQSRYHRRAPCALAICVRTSNDEQTRIFLVTAGGCATQSISLCHPVTGMRGTENEAQGIIKYIASRSF